MQAVETILSKFNAALNCDRQRQTIPDWMTRWNYQDAQAQTSNASRMDFSTYNGTQDFADWFQWDALTGSKPEYLPADRLLPLAAKSFAMDRKFVAQNAIQYPDDQLKLIARGNAVDFIYQTMYPVPERQKLRRILDFGAGFGRQMNLWSQSEQLLSYVAMDGIARSYSLQHVYARHMELAFTDYVDDPDNFEITDTQKPTIFHLPTWRYDCLRSNYFDAVFCNHVLTEVDPNLCVLMIREFFRVLKPGGMFYLRDHDARFSPNHMPLNSLIPMMGFVLEFRPFVSDLAETHGIPKIWRKISEREIMSLP